MTDDIFSDRRRALEESFFAKRNQELLEQMRTQYNTQQSKEQLAALSGIQDPVVLDRLVSLGIHPETFAAVALIPLVLIAWSDDFLDARERQRILKAAESVGLTPQRPAYELLASWLDDPPDPRLLDDWKAYIAVLKTKLPPERLAELRQDVLGRARLVAKATGGLFGVRSINAGEQSLLDQLELAFS